MGRKGILGIALLLGGLGVGAAVLQAATGLVGQWEFDAPSVVDDISPSNLDGTLVGAPTAVADVPAPIAAYSTESLDVGPAVQYLEIPNAAPLNTLQQGSYTVMAWFKANSMAQAAPNAVYAIVMKSGYNEGIYWQNGIFAMEHWTTNTNTGAMPVADQVFPSTAGLWTQPQSVGQWYHVAGVVDATARTTTVLVHNTGGGAPLTATTNWSSYPLVATSWVNHAGIPWRVGDAVPGSPSVQWQADGLIDDVRLYNRALTTAEVTAIATGADLGAATPTTPPPPPPPPPPPAVPRTEGNDEGLIGDRCACGSTAGPAPLGLALALAVALAAAARRRPR